MHRKRQKDHADKTGTNNWPVIDGIIIGLICISKQLFYTCVSDKTHWLQTTYFVFNKDVAIIFLIKHFYFSVIIFL